MEKTLYKYSVKSVFIGFLNWTYAVLFIQFIASNEEFGQFFEVSIKGASGLLFLLLLFIGSYISVKSLKDELNTFKVLGIVLNMSIFISILLLIALS